MLREEKRWERNKETGDKRMHCSVSFQNLKMRVALRHVDVGTKHWEAKKRNCLDRG